MLSSHPSPVPTEAAIFESVRKRSTLTEKALRTAINGAKIEAYFFFLVSAPVLYAHAQSIDLR